MRPSSLLLDSYYVEELCFSVDPKYKFDPSSEEEEPKIQPDDIEVNVEPFHHPGDPLKWYFKLWVKLDDKEGKFPYVFSIRLSGFFEVSKSYSGASADQFAQVNAPSILYSAARELLAVATGRARHLSVILPLVTFYEPPAAAAPTLTTESGTKPADAQAIKEPPHKAAKKGARKKGTKKKVQA